MSLIEARNEALRVMSDPSSPVPYDVFGAVWDLINAINDHIEQVHSDD